jgi:Rha family phage regulatory protein
MNSQIQPLVTLSHNRPITTSLTVGDHFVKKHLHVLEAIRNLDCSADFRESNFRFTSYNDIQNKSRPMCEITRDGFMFLCMGFTGANAAHWKEIFIKEFNRMEQSLSGRAPNQADMFAQPAAPAPTLTAKFAELEAKLAHSLETQALQKQLIASQAMVVALTANPKPKRTSPRREPVTAAEMESMRRLHAEGMSNTAIAKKLGRSTATVSWAVREQLI